MFEVITAFIHEEYKVSRKKATGIIISATFVLGVICSLSLGPWSGFTIFGKTVFDLFDYISANILLPLCGLLVSIFVGYRLDRKIVQDELTNNGENKIWYLKPLVFVLRYIAPVAIILIFLSSIGII